MKTKQKIKCMSSLVGNKFRGSPSVGVYDNKCQVVIALVCHNENPSHSIMSPLVCCQAWKDTVIFKHLFDEGDCESSVPPR